MRKAQYSKRDSTSALIGGNARAAEKKEHKPKQKRKADTQPGSRHSRPVKLLPFGRLDHVDIIQKAEGSDERERTVLLLKQEEQGGKKRGKYVR